MYQLSSMMSPKHSSSTLHIDIQWCERQKLTYVKFWRYVWRYVNCKFCNFFTFTLTWHICYFLLTFYVYVWRKFKFSRLFEHVIFQFCEKFLRVWKIVCFPRFYSFSSQYSQTLVQMKFLVTVNRFFKQMARHKKIYEYNGDVLMT